MNNLIARGKMKNKNEWIEGHLIQDRDGSSFIVIDYKSSWTPELEILDKYIVEQESVALKTGLKDKDNNNIWGSIEIDGEMTKGGDIVKFPYVIPMGNHKEYIYTAQVIYEAGTFYHKIISYDGKKLYIDHTDIKRWRKQEKGDYISNYGHKIIIKDKCDLKIIGNGYNNPELLEENDE